MCIRFDITLKFQIDLEENFKWIMKWKFVKPLFVMGMKCCGFHNVYV